MKDTTQNRYIKLQQMHKQAGEVVDEAIIDLWKIADEAVGNDGVETPRRSTVITAIRRKLYTASHNFIEANEKLRRGL